MMMEKKRANLKRLIHPDSIAFIGTYHIIRQGIENVQRMGFDGTIFAVHQSRDEINGIQCVKSIKELPFNIDAAFVAVNAKTAVEVVRELQEHGTSGVVCYAAGFSEIGENELQMELVQAAGDMALVGPNCYG